MNTKLNLSFFSAIFQLSLLSFSCQNPMSHQKPDYESKPLESSRTLADFFSEEQTKKFDFCPLSKDFSSTNALWLTFLSSLEYHHFGVAAPILDRLGFGSSDLAISWVKHWYALRIKRINENKKNIDDTWNNEEERQKKLATLYDEYRRIFQEEYIDNSLSSEGYEYEIVSGKNKSKPMQFLSSFNGDEGMKTKGAAQAFYAEHRSMPLAVLVVRGTEVDEPRDLAADLKFLHTTFHEKGNVHTGFYGHSKTIWPAIEKVLLERSTLAEQQKKTFKLWVAGHSLGGAVATLLTAKIMDLQEKGRLKGIQLMGVYTLGSPRVGDVSFAANFHSQAAKQNISVYRIRNSKDLVTGVPVSGPFGGEGYRHVGSLVYISQKGEVFFGNGNGIIEKSSDYLQTTTNSFSHHATTAYWDRLKTFHEKTSSAIQCPKPENPPLTPFIEGASQPPTVESFDLNL